MQTVQSLARQADIGIPMGSDDLWMVPITRREPSRLEYQPLQAALAAGTLRITEVSDSGSVPEVRVVNDGKLPVLLLDGAALVGAKQDRVLNLTILVPPRATTLVPVSCVEQGRWHARSADFAEGESLHFAGPRARKMSSVSASMARGAGRRSDQGQVWEDVACCAADFRASAPTGAMRDVGDAVRGSTDRLLAELQPVEEQAGAAFVSRGRLLGMDLFDSASTFRTEFAKIARSYAVEALRSTTPPGSGADSRPEAVRLARLTLEYLSAGQWRAYPGLGLGTDLRLTTTRLVAGALVHEDEVVHLAAFPGEAAEARDADSLAPSLRRRWYA